MKWLALTRGEVEVPYLVSRAIGRIARSSLNGHSERLFLRVIAGSSHCDSCYTVFNVVSGFEPVLVVLSVEVEVFEVGGIL